MLNNAKELVAKMEDLLPSRGSFPPHTKDQISTEIDNLVNAMRLDIMSHNRDKDIDLSCLSGRQGTSWPRHKGIILDNYERMNRTYTNLVDLEEAFHRNEKKQQTRALLFRFLTTAVVSFTILGVYAVGAYLKIPMPFRFTAL